MKTPEQIQFQGSAQSRGFAPVVQASPTQLIEENTNRLLAGQARNFEMESANLDAVNALQRKFAKQDIDALASMSGTLADVLTQEAKRQGERDMEEGLMQAYLDGIDPAESMAFDIAEGYLKNNDDQLQSIGDQAQASGAPFMGVQKIRELSGWKAYGYAMGMAQNASNAYPAFMEQALANVPSDLSPADKAVYLSNARAQFLRQSGLTGMNPALLNKYAFPGMREADSVILNRWRKQQEDEIKGQMIDEAQTIMGTDPVGNFQKAQDLMVRGGMDRRKARVSALGMLKPEELEDLADEMSWDGVLTWEQKYPLDFRNARRDAVRDEVADYESQQAGAALEGKKWFDSVQEMWEKEPPTEAEVEAAERFMSDNFNYVDGRLGERWKSRTTDAEAKAYYRQQFDQLERAGMLTEAALNDPAVPSDVRRSFLAQAQQQDKARRDTPEFKQYTKQIEADLKRHSGQETLDTLGAPGVEIAIAAAQSKFQKDVMAAVSSGTMSPSQAAEAAYGAFQQQLATAAQENSPFYINADKGFVNQIKSKGFGNWQQHINSINSLMRDKGVSALDRTHMVPLTTLQDAVQNINNPNYQIPPIAAYISDKLGGTVTPWAVLDRQARVRGLGGLPPNPRLQSQTQGMRPEFVRMLHYKPSYNRVSRAYASTGSFNPDRVPKGYGQTVLEAASANGIDPAILAGLLETESNFNPSARSSAGAVGIAQIMPGYHPTVDPTNATASIHYAAKHLKGLMAATGSIEEAIYAYNGGLGGIRKSAENRAYQPKVMRAAAKYGYNPTGNPWRNPALLNPRIAYITGNIGPTSTGPHLDVKQADGRDFSKTALDRYVEVDDPQYGRVPLSKVPVTADAANHRRRGSHGIDYGTASGSRVYLKGGARVVGSTRTEHGDKLTIQLPNGKKYTFLHGRSA
jgi:hypothetical protein